ncbi:MAG: hypothetical protein PHS04_06395 [Tissierellia bacterium]|nr:hypothetical protein [Tissierellia bacterium]
MGMYDYIELDVSCPICGNSIINTFQTKDFECLMDTYQPGDEVPADCRFSYVRAYTTCDHRREITKIEDELVFTLITGYWIEYEIPIIAGVIARDQNLWKRKIEPTAYNALSVAPERYTEEELYAMIEKLNEKIKKDIEVTKFENQNHIIRN